MRIVITGGLGHIGSKLIRELNADITVIDNLRTERYCSLFNLSNKVKFIQADIMDADLDQIFNGADTVIHLGAIVDAENSHNVRDLVNQVNIEGTRRVAQACVRNNCALIFASTTSVYGIQDEVDETCSELKPQSPYAESKLEAEQVIQWMKGLRYTILRMGTIFGISPGMRFHTAVNKFCFQASLKQPITVWKTAIEQKRPYLDLSDMVRATQFILENKVYHNEIYNLVTLNTTVRNITEIISQSIAPVFINYVHTPIMNQLSYTISNKKFTDLGFEFTGDINKGITQTLNLLSGVTQ